MTLVYLCILTRYDIIQHIHFMPGSEGSIGRLCAKIELLASA